MTKRKIIIGLLGLFLIVIVVFLLIVKSGKYRNTDTQMNRIGLSLFDMNYITVNANGISEADLKIIWRAGFDSCLVYRNGKYIGGIKNEKDMYSFYILINDNPIMKVTHFNEQSWHSNHYVFNLNYENDNYSLVPEADGLCKKFYVKNLLTQEKTEIKL